MVLSMGESWRICTFGGVRPLSMQQPARYTPAAPGPKASGRRTLGGEEARREVSSKADPPGRNRGARGRRQVVGVTKRAGPVRRCRQPWAGEPRAQEERA